MITASSLPFRPLPDTPGAGGFVSKPARGWLHPEQDIIKDGVSYAVRYIGCLEVHSSMKSLDFDTRSQVAKECITRACEAAGLKTQDKKRKVDKRVCRAISDRPNMDHAGANVKLVISSSGLKLSVLESDQAIAKHEMPRISFASGGDTDTLDFVAYVAKDSKDWRACYVLECGGGLAQDVITTIGQAFELRFQQFLTRASPDRDYYNDLPGKIPPEAGPPPVPPLPTTREGVVSNLIDLNCEVQAPVPAPRRENDYQNDVRDVFDMQPFGTMMRVELQKETWFHGPVSRQQAESLLLKDGDFLVRESQGSWGQYVLTGMQGGIKKHLLLVDPEGVVRTKDRMFESVSHLINYHCQNELPIISAESALVLRSPVHRRAE